MIWPAQRNYVNDPSSPSFRLANLNIVDSGAVFLRHNKGEVDLSGLVAQQKPNLEGCVKVFKAAESYNIKGLPEAATAAFHERSVKFSEHAELKRLMESGLPPAFKRV